jgi:hypothetical protein
MRIAVACGLKLARKKNWLVEARCAVSLGSARALPRAPAPVVEGSDRAAQPARRAMSSARPVEETRRRGGSALQSLDDSQDRFVALARRRPKSRRLARPSRARNIADPTVVRWWRPAACVAG